MRSTIENYYAAFNAGDIEGMLALVDDNIAHHVNEGQVRQGKDLFRAFCLHMEQCYKENLTDMEIFVNDAGTRGAAEFVVNGTYLATDEGLPEARGQTYKLPAGAFLDLRDGKITRVTTYYNLADWMRQVA